MDDTITVILPVSGKTVVIRNYTTRKDDQVSNEALYRGVSAKNSEAGTAVDFPIGNVMASQEAYVPRLVQSIDGSSNVQKMIEDLRSEDYEALEKAVLEIVEEHSPKAKGGKSASDKATNEK